MNTPAKANEIAAICRMQIELVEINAATFFPGQALADVLDLHFVLLHLFLADAKGCQLSVSGLARAMGLSRGGVEQSSRSWWRWAGAPMAARLCPDPRHRETPFLARLLAQSRDHNGGRQRGGGFGGQQVADSAMANLAS
jgi:hypothetical protein